MYFKLLFFIFLFHLLKNLYFINRTSANDFNLPLISFNLLSNALNLLFQ